MSTRLSFRKPMLAQTLTSEKLAALKYPIYGQEKLDGVRCVTDGQRFWSREGKLFPAQNFTHLIVPNLPFLMDGELMVPNAKFEDTVSSVKRVKGARDVYDKRSFDNVRFFAFDTFLSLPFSQRLEMAFSMFRRAERHGAKWEFVSTQLIDSKKELRQFAKKNLRQGYEGTMIRTVSGLYVSRRSPDLLKWKPLHDAEFEIVDIVEAKGKDRGTPIFICLVDRGISGGWKNMTFRVRPKGTMDQRRAMWKDRKKLIGQELTVEYANITKHGKPRMPRAKVLRNYE